jgi:hypothetical protein
LLKHDELADQIKKQTRKPTLKLVLTLKREVPFLGGYQSNREKQFTYDERDYISKLNKKMII